MFLFFVKQLFLLGCFPVVLIYLDFMILCFFVQNLFVIAL